MAMADAGNFSFTTEQIERFWSYVAFGKPGECWIWTRAKNVSGHGVFHPKHHVTSLCHRLAWSLINGPIPKGMQVLHNCPGGDNASCCNPSHLFLGTQADNVRDAFAKGRMVPRNKNPICKGSRHGMSVMTEDVVRSMRQDYANGKSIASLARKHGVTNTAASYAIRRITWKHVE